MDVPRVIILFQGESHVCVIICVAGDDTQQHIRFPMIPVIIPTGTHGEHRHGTCELYFRIAGDDPLPCVLVPLHSFRVFILLRMECKGKDTS